MKVFIWGSAVSIDCFNYPPASSLEIAAYHARCSCASAMSEPVPLTDINLDVVASENKRQTIVADFQKRLLKELETKEFDILFIDFIDERFPLRMDAEGRVITVSAELQETGSVDMADESLIHVGSEKRFALWREAWGKFMNFCSRHGIKDKIVLNCVRWADQMEDGGPVTGFSASYIARHNAFLDRIYATVATDISENRLIRYPEDLLVASSTHRCISPLQYPDQAYKYANRCLFQMMPIIPAELNDRLYDSFTRYSLQDQKSRTARIIHNASRQEDTSDGIRLTFADKDKYYYFRIILPQKIEGDGIAVTFRISGWQEDYSYSLGYICGTKLYRVKGKHLLDGQWYTLVCSKRDIVFMLDNPDAEEGTDPLQDIRLIISGTFAEEATLEVREVCAWEETQGWAGQLALANEPVEDRKLLLAKLAAYLREAHAPEGEYLYGVFRKQGAMPIFKKNIAWEVEEDYPDNLGEVATFAWSWLCLHPVQLCALEAYDKDDTGALCAAREFAAAWLDKFFRKEKMPPTAWHEHGAAERTLSLLFLYLLGYKYGFDYRFQSRIKIAVIQHARLLCSEAFYVRHQRIRFHNHGMFQDIALLLAGTVFAELPGSEHWRAVGQQRLREMLDAIYPSDGQFRISYENSFGYHRMGSQIIETLTQLISASENSSYFLRGAQEIQGWSELLRYSPQQFPAFGDTYRNGSGERYRHAERPGKRFCLAQKSGYAVIRGHHDETFFMIVQIASSLSTTHKHCDNLSFSLYFDGIEWLIDPSFYNHENASISVYLRSPEAHNALCIPKTPYSITPGLCKLEGNADGDAFRLHGSHSCYEGFSVSRTLEGRLDSLDLNITDQVSPAPADARMRLHCGERITTEPCPEGMRLMHPDSQYSLIIHCACPCNVLHGQENGGIAGTGFCQSTEIDTLEFAISNSDAIRWRISVANVQR